MDCCEISCSCHEISQRLPQKCLTWLKYLGKISVMMLVHCVLSFVVLSGWAYESFYSDGIQYFFRIRMNVLFGCGIGVSILVFCAIWFFIYHPRFLIHYILTIPSVIIVLAHYIEYTGSDDIDNCIASFDKMWPTVATFSKFQVASQCCGWWNATDRGLTNCPMWYKSGCAPLVRKHVAHKFSEIRTWSIFILVVFISSVIIFTVLEFTGILNC